MWKFKQEGGKLKSNAMLSDRRNDCLSRRSRKIKKVKSRVNKNKVGYENNKFRAYRVNKNKVYKNDKTNKDKVGLNSEVLKKCQTTNKEWNEWLKYVKNFISGSKVDEKKREEIEKTEVFPCVVKKPNDNRPYLEISVYEHKFTVLIDTGCNRTVIAERAMGFLRKCDVKIFKFNSQYVSMADGHMQRVKWYCYLPYTLNNETKIVKTLILPDLSHYLIMGMDFCNKFGLEIVKKDKWISDPQLKFVDCPDVLPSVMEMSADVSDDFVNLTPSQRVKASQIVESFKEISDDSKLGRTDAMIYHIDTGDALPVRQKQYPLSPFMLNALNKELDEMLDLDVVEESHSSWSSPVLLVKKADGESYRFVFDGRSLNRLTKPDSYPLPNVDRILYNLRNAKYISSVDLRHAFWQIPLDKQSREKTAFAVPGRGLFQFKVLPFGLRSGSQAQQRLMDKIFGPKAEPNVFVYLDDLIIISSSFEEHLQILQWVKEMLRDAKLTINLKKCQFFRNSLNYLGFVVDSEGIKTDPKKVSAMVNFPRPRTYTELKRFLGMTGWYRRFIYQFSSVVAPLNELLKGKKKYQKLSWNSAAEEAFSNIKNYLISAPLLSSPDFSVPFSVQCDASQYGAGCVLTQVQNDVEKVIAFASRTFSNLERNYTVLERELLAILFAFEKFRCYVEACPHKVTVITDNASIKWLNNLKDPSGRLSRWAVKLHQYNIDIVHRKGRHNIVPDALSRAPLPEVCLLEFASEKLDPWYSKMLKEVSKKSEKYKNWSVREKTLYKFIPNVTDINTNIKEWKVVVPVAYREEVLNSCHSDPTSSHLGFYKTYKKICEEYYWPKMRQHVLQFVKSCLICQAQKIPGTLPQGLMGTQKKVSYPWQCISMDLMGPFPRSTQGNTFLLVVSDYFSKYVLLKPIRKATAKSIISFVENEVFLIYGVPQFIVCDNGTQFAGNEFRALAKSYEVQKIYYNAKYHPQINQTERVNRVIGTAIRSYIKANNHKEWDKQIPKIAYALRAATHEVTGHSPTFLNFGRKVPVSGLYYDKFSGPPDLEIASLDITKYSGEIVKLANIYKDVQARMNVAYERNSRHYNLRRREIEFRVGEKVWKRNKVLSDATKQFSAKLAPKYVLCMITKKMSKLVYRLEQMNGSDVGNWHVKDLKKYYGSNSDVSEK